MRVSGNISGRYHQTPHCWQETKAQSKLNTFYLEMRSIFLSAKQQRRRTVAIIQMWI